MGVIVYWCRATCFGEPCGPWRFGVAAARRDLIAADLGSYDEDGTFYITVPGGIDRRSEWMSLEEEAALAGPVKRDHSSDNRESLSVSYRDRSVRRVGGSRF